MASWVPLVALALFPLAYLAALNPIRFSWGFHHGSERMPHDVLERAEHADCYFEAVSGFLLICLLAALMLLASIAPTRVGLNSKSWLLNALIGILASVPRVTLQGLAWKFMPSLRSDSHHPELRKGPAWFWILSTLLGAFAEELWIAVCIVILLATSHSAWVSVIATATVFGLMHYAYRFGGVLAIALYGAIFGWLFVSRGSLLPSYLFHCIGNLSVLYWTRRGASQ